MGKKVTGSKDLKGTQSYPDPFGHKTARVYWNNMVPIGPGFTFDEPVAHEANLSDDPWDDADLDGLIATLRQK